MTARVLSKRSQSIGVLSDVGVGSVHKVQSCGGMLPDMSHSASNTLVVVMSEHARWDPKLKAGWKPGSHKTVTIYRKTGQ